MHPPLLAAVVVTFRRDRELARLLHSLEASTLQPSLVVIVDHAGLPSTQALIAKFHLETFYVASPDNPGPGAGWKNGMQTALRLQPETTDFLVLDDDVVLPPEAIARLKNAAENAGMTCPMLLNSDEKIWAFPEPAAPSLRKIIRGVQTPEECIARLGTHPQPFLWCTGACLLVRRDAVEAVGFYRTDFWMLGEDLEFSMRVAAHSGGLFLPDLFVPHLPPASSDPQKAVTADRKKFQSLLQNLAYLSFHHRNSAHLRTYLPGNARRYFRTFGWNISSASQIARCLWNGAIRAEPAGARRTQT